MRALVGKVQTVDSNDVPTSSRDVDSLERRLATCHKTRGKYADVKDRVKNVETTHLQNYAAAESQTWTCGSPT